MTVFHYDHILQELGRRPGMLGDIFERAKSALVKPETLRRLIVDLIDPEIGFDGCRGQRRRALATSSCALRSRRPAQLGRIVVRAEALRSNGASLRRAWLSMS
jgi:hypothetical protein